MICLARDTVWFIQLQAVTKSATLWREVDGPLQVCMYASNW